MQRQVVNDAKKWWDETRRLWLRNLLQRESLGLPRRSLADYAEERARLLHVQLPPDPWGRKDMQSAERSSTAASVSTSGAVCQASFQKASSNTSSIKKNMKHGKDKTVREGSRYHTIKTSEKQPPDSSVLRGPSRNSECNRAIVFPCMGSWS